MVNIFSAERSSQESRGFSHERFKVENVDSNNKADLAEISQCLGVEPIMIDSNLFSAQDRKRNYWTNIPIAPLPMSCDLVLKDIMDDEVDEKFYYKQPFTYHGEEKKFVQHYI